MRSMIFVLFLGAVAMAADKELLLTANGVSNPEHSEYKEKPVADLKGAGYYAEPPMKLEKGAAAELIPFSKGILTNGDASTTYKHVPTPYTYWTKPRNGEIKGNLFFVFGQPCKITRARIRIMITESSKIAKITLFIPGPDGKPAQAGVIPEPKNGWNEIKDINATVAELHMTFDGTDKTFMHVNEVEVWGVPAEATPAPAAPTR